MRVTGRAGRMRNLSRAAKLVTPSSERQIEISFSRISSSRTIPGAPAAARPQT